MRVLGAALLLLVESASANKTATWLDKRAKLIGDVYGKGVSINHLRLCKALRARHAQGGRSCVRLVQPAGAPQ